MLIAQATKNAALLDTIERLWAMRTEIPSIKQAYDSICGMAPEERLKEHTDIAEAIRDRDSAKARQAMRSHFTCIIEALLRAIEAREMEAIRRKTDESRARFLVTNAQLTG
jgi:DNA-binding FadR family transcriptional regulator